MSAVAPKIQAERVAELLIALEAVDLATLHAAPLVLLTQGQRAMAIVGLRVAGRRFRLSIDEVQLAAKCLRAETELAGAGELAAGLIVGAGVADLLLLAEQARRIQRLPAFIDWDAD